MCNLERKLLKYCDNNLHNEMKSLTIPLKNGNNTIINIVCFSFIIWFTTVVNPKVLGNPKAKEGKIAKFYTFVSNNFPIIRF